MMVKTDFTTDFAFEHIRYYKEGCYYIVFLFYYTAILYPKTIKIIFVFAAHKHIHTIKNNDMHFNRNQNGTGLPANSDN